jgi:L-asparaginase/beta-aspartyl-peptidase (threonine type)
VNAIVLTHGGASARMEWADGCDAAARAAMQILEAGQTALEAAIAAVNLLEGDGRFNAGKGSVLRMDGVSMEMDAALMDDVGRLAAVAGIRDIEHPILLAREVLSTPHCMLAGEGAIAFARKRGIPEYRHQPGLRARELHRQIMREMVEGDFTDMPQWADQDWRRDWNFLTDPELVAGACDTVGAVVRDRHGHFAVATSTGGAAPMLRGRIGDAPLVGCGFFAGPHGGVVATGIGEEITRRMVARSVYEGLAAGMDPESACRRVLADFPEAWDLGILAVSAQGGAHVANRTMPVGREERP